MSQIIKNYAAFGEVEFRSYSRSKSIRIRIKPFGGVLVTYPKYVSFKKVELFITEKSGWIKENIKKVAAFERTAPVIGSDFETKSHTLQIKWTNANLNKIRVINNCLIVYLPIGSQINDSANQEQIKKGVDRVLKIEAVEYLPKRLSELAKVNNLLYHDLRIKNIRSRWGSCSIKNNINLSIHLMRLPYELIDYVLLHELTHTIIKNHSQKFWQKLEEFLPNSKKYDGQLKNYSTRIY
ncbi:MAG: M48 family metallopeptidase [Melioribacteraceae bacterium]|nr:M48 family metallopeptidase [Melioribacteraceae bacterium]MCF8264952.1 M48 family metallopeptidase [Melioribacteraceae bacterium]MCF8413786.1 M48 family metallopeptidase [Melioribacteraceae bacterium]MCF8431968.1 M48 family metallopeptidase [Melioribacteraceae bacterium]